MGYRMNAHALPVHLIARPHEEMGLSPALGPNARDVPQKTTHWAMTNKSVDDGFLVAAMHSHQHQQPARAHHPR